MQCNGVKAEGSLEPWFSTEGDLGPIWEHLAKDEGVFDPY